MKYFFALSILLIAGCSAPTNNQTPATTTASVDTVPPFSQGGIYYVAPGTFKGTWVNTTFPNYPPYMVSDTQPCTAVITEADSLLAGTITNDSTKEVLTLKGVHTLMNTTGITPTHEYGINAVSSIGDTNLVTQFYFSERDAYYGPFIPIGSDGQNFEYWGSRKLLNGAGSEFDIFCTRISGASK